MININWVVLSGNCTQDIRTTETPSSNGSILRAHFTLGRNDRRDQASFFGVTCFCQAARYIEKTPKGTLILVEGYLEQNQGYPAQIVATRVHPVKYPADPNKGRVDTNTVIVTGTTTHPPESFESGVALSFARENTDGTPACYRARAFGRTADTLKRLDLPAGTLVSVRGRLEQERWQTGGENRPAVVIVAAHMGFIGPSKK